ncbi:hypothetical protein AB0O05_15320 [Streptomyces sp. NPDC093084]|uniref:hypothetical protein n=1 Tax=Streptomyces sp. NPDC093084 TaxID=3155197 RepID=UPI003428812B
MHRTTTTAALLVTVTVAALSGCVTVQRPAAPGSPPGSAPLQPSVPRPDGSAEPRVVQAPAKEALEMVGPSRPSRRAAPASPRTAVPPPPPPPAHPHSAAPHAAAPQPQPRPRRTLGPRAEAPGLSGPVPKAPDVCSLGRQYGGWPQDSPQARICDQTYGH